MCAATEGPALLTLFMKTALEIRNETVTILSFIAISLILPTIFRLWLSWPSPGDAPRQIACRLRHWPSCKTRLC